MNPLILAFFVATFYAGDPQPTIQELPNGDIRIDATLRQWVTYDVWYSQDMDTWRKMPFGAVHGNDQRNYLTLFKSHLPEGRNYYRIRWYVMELLGTENERRDRGFD